MDLRDKINVSVDPQNIHYAEAIFSRIVVREVYDGDNPNGTYHIKPIDNINTVFLVNFLRDKIPGVEIDQVDSSGTLNLEFPIYLISHNSREGLVLSIEKADESLDEFIKNRNKP